MNYFAYARISKKKLALGHSKSEQVKPLTEFLKSKGYNQNQIANHLVCESYYGIKSQRPKFKQIFNKAKSSHNDITLVFARLSRLGRTLSEINSFIANCILYKIRIYVLDGNWLFDPSERGIIFLNAFHSLLDLNTDLTTEKANEARRVAKISNHHNLVGGNEPRFYSNHKNYYIQVYKFNQNHSERETAKHFHKSIRTITRIKRSGDEYFNKTKNNLF